MISRWVYFFCLILVGGATANAADDQQALDVIQPGEASVVVVQVHGKVFQAPYFDPNAKPLPKEVRDFHTKLVQDVMGPMKDILDAAFIEANGFRLASQVPKVAFQYAQLALFFFSETNSLQRQFNLPSDREFQLYSIQVFPELIKRAKRELDAASPEEIRRFSNPVARRRFGVNLLKIVDGVQLLVARSPVGMYLDFNAITVDGKLLADEGIEGLKFLHKNGFGWAIDTLDWLCRVIAREQEDSSKANSRSTGMSADFEDSIPAETV